MFKNCPKCNTQHSKSGTFCSHSCANSRTFSAETNLLKSKSAKASKKVAAAREAKLGPKIQKICPICNIQFEVNPSSSHRILCSRKCFNNGFKSNTKNKGGYRDGSGRSINGRYQGIYCGSTYELVWVMYNLHHNIKFNRFEGFILYDGNRKYYPDFIIDNTIYEMKGYHTEVVQRKSAAAIAEGYQIKVMYKDDLQYAFDWFKQTYPNKQLKDMYD